VNHAARLEALRHVLARERVDCLLVGARANIFYLTGFTGSAGLLLVDESRAVLFTDGRYAVQAPEEAGAAARVVICKGGIEKAALARAKGYRRVGFEASAGYRFYQAAADGVGARRLRARDGLVEQLRLVKDEQEIARIRDSVLLNSRIFEETVPSIRPEVAEQEIAAELEYRMRRAGAERPAFETIVAAGPRSAMPHARAGPRPVGKNALLVLDHGAILAGYASDMTRTVFTGKAGERARSLYEVVLEAQQRAIASVRAGVRCSRVDYAARAYIRERGYGAYFPHSTGHGLGVEVHEAPRVAARQKMPLPAGAVITIEPGVYVPGFGGVRIEDVVVVREQGAQVLTPTPKRLLELG